MGCLNLHIDQIGGAKLSSDKIGDCDLGITWIDGCALRHEQKGGLSINILFVCNVSQREFLRVTPTQPLWIVVGEDLTYNVRSNTDWLVT